eukprot:m.6704 g.6704  ORF g.6704 m.6704 type:complete len:802 (+) comp5183_c0_seq2:208-2613(+)
MSHRRQIASHQELCLVVAQIIGSARVEDPVRHSLKLRSGLKLRENASIETIVKEHWEPMRADAPRAMTVQIMYSNTAQPSPVPIEAWHLVMRKDSKLSREAVALLVRSVLTYTRLLPAYRLKQNPEFKDFTLSIVFNEQETPPSFPDSKTIPMFNIGHTPESRISMTVVTAKDLEGSIHMRSRSSSVVLPRRSSSRTNASISAHTSPNQPVQPVQTVPRTQRSHADLTSSPRSMPAPLHGGPEARAETFSEGVSPRGANNPLEARRRIQEQYQRTKGGAIQQVQRHQQWDSRHSPRLQRANPNSKPSSLGKETHAQASSIPPHETIQFHDNSPSSSPQMVRRPLNRNGSLPSAHMPNTFSGGERAGDHVHYGSLAAQHQEGFVPREESQPYHPSSLPTRAFTDPSPTMARRANGQHLHHGSYTGKTDGLQRGYPSASRLSGAKHSPSSRTRAGLVDPSSSPSSLPFAMSSSCASDPQGSMIDIIAEDTFKHPLQQAANKHGMTIEDSLHEAYASFDDESDFVGGAQLMDAARQLARHPGLEKLSEIGPSRQGSSKSGGGRTPRERSPHFQRDAEPDVFGSGQWSGGNVDDDDDSYDLEGLYFEDELAGPGFDEDDEMGDGFATGLEQLALEADRIAKQRSHEDQNHGSQDTFLHLHHEADDESDEDFPFAGELELGQAAGFTQGYQDSDASDSERTPTVRSTHSSTCDSPARNFKQKSGQHSWKSQPRSNASMMHSPFMDDMGDELYSNPIQLSEDPQESPYTLLDSVLGESTAPTLDRKDDVEHQLQLMESVVGSHGGAI